MHRFWVEITSHWYLTVLFCLIVLSALAHLVLAILVLRRYKREDRALEERRRTNAAVPPPAPRTPMTPDEQAVEDARMATHGWRPVPGLPGAYSQPAIEPPS